MPHKKLGPEVVQLGNRLEGTPLYKPYERSVKNVIGFYKKRSRSGRMVTHPRTIPNGHWHEPEMKSVGVGGRTILVDHHNTGTRESVHAAELKQKQKGNKIIRTSAGPIGKSTVKRLKKEGILTRFGSHKKKNAEIKKLKKGDVFVDDKNTELAKAEETGAVTLKPRAFVEEYG